MKTLQLLSLLLFVGFFSLSSCGEEDPIATCSDGIKNQNETDIDCGGICTACQEGAHGTWHSFPVAPILVAFADSINATFNTDNTYLVEQWKDNAKVTLSGTFVQSASGTGNIYNITLTQSTPTAITVQGILEVSADDSSMKYEIVQIDPAIAGVTPPTAAAGFGSTSGGAFGEANVQVYARR